MSWDQEMNREVREASLFFNSFFHHQEQQVRQDKRFITRNEGGGNTRTRQRVRVRVNKRMILFSQSADDKET